MARVWVTNFAGHNYVSAQSYGELRYIIKGYVSMRRTDRVVYEIVESLREAQPGDYLLLSGMNFINVIAALVWARYLGEVNLLVWDKKQKVYSDYTVSPDHLDLLWRSDGHSFDDDTEDSRDRERGP
jgi:hypothetical protein